MRPDFKDKAPAKRTRQSSARQKSYGSNFVSGLGTFITTFITKTLALLKSGISFYKANWQANTAALVSCLALVLVIVNWGGSKPSEPALVDGTESKTAPISSPQDKPITHIKGNWSAFPLELPISEQELIKQKLRAQNLLSNTDKSKTPKSTSSQPDDKVNWQEWTVKSGDSFAAIAQRHGVSPSEVHNLMTNNDKASALTRIFPGQIIRATTSVDGKLKSLQYDITDTQMLSLSRQKTPDTTGSLFAIKTVEKPYEIQTTYAQATISESLFLASMKAGISDRLTMELAGIFGWDIDFVQDIRSGDSFSIIYEERSRNGIPIKGSKAEGNILAAEFKNNGETYRAIRYTLPDGRTDYFSPDGKSLRKAFIRNPVDFARISSKFNLKRKHPILNKIRAHKGVDYAAATGTPIRSVGNGKVIFRGVKGGYGNTVIIKHGSTYTTLYAHMSKYARGSGQGNRVKQGQVIGYIGMSGLATGPHLHYEFRVNGTHRNPLTVKHPSVKPIPKKYLSDFINDTADLVAQLDLVGQTQFAYNN